MHPSCQESAHLHHCIIESATSTRREQRTKTSLPQADDELEAPYLAGFEWDQEECYTKFIVHQKKTGEAASSSSKKKKAKGNEDE